MGQRSIKQIWQAGKVNMGGIILDQAIPIRGVDQIDPVLLIHHWSNTLKGGQKQSEVGVGPHPHRGFIPVTFIFKGGVHHRDSKGHEAVVYAGGTQWMHSGSGIVHSERPAVELAEKGGDFEIIQFWVNVPAANKMIAPKYISLHERETPKVQSTDGKVTVGVVAGVLKGKKGGILPETDMLLLRIEGKSGGVKTLDVPQDYNALLYVLDGSVNVNGQNAGDKALVWFGNDGDKVNLHFSGDTRAILLSGKPIAEPVATYGPFVMNTEEEIEKAITDYQYGRMGRLVEKFD